MGALTRPSATLSQRERGWIWDGSHRPSATCETGCVKTPVPRYERPIRHSRESGNPGVLEGSPAPFPHSTPPGFPLTRPCQNCPLSLWERVGVRATPTAQAAIDPLSLRERVGVREPRGKQAGVNGKEWERQGYWGPSPGLRPPSPRGRGVEFRTGRTGLRPPSPRGRGVGFGTGRGPAFGHLRNRLCQNASSQVRKANPSFPRTRESRGPGGVPTRRFPTPPRLDSRLPGRVKTAPSPSGRGLG